MIDDSERREVARQLAREAQTWRETFPDSECDFSDAAAMMQDLCVFIGLERDALCSEVFKRLADLIDVPTTVLDLTETTRTVHGEEVRGWECRECGQSCEEMYGSYEYCPHCGRKVVDK